MPKLVVAVVAVVGVAVLIVEFGVFTFDDL
jgi:hypothetical protein